MAVCGDRYKHLAVTVSGYSFSNPYGLFAMWYADYVEWQTVAERMVELVNQHLAALQVVELKKNPTLPQFNKFAAERTILLQHYEDLPSKLSIFVDKGPIDEAMSVVSEALCLLEQIDEAIEGYGEKPPELPSVRPPVKPPWELPKPPKPEDVPWYVWLIGGAATVAIVAGLYQRARGPQGTRR